VEEVLDVAWKEGSASLESMRREEATIGWNALHFASAFGQTAVARKLVSTGFNPSKIVPLFPERRRQALSPPPRQYGGGGGLRVSGRCTTRPSRIRYTSPLGLAINAGQLDVVGLLLLSGCGVDAVHTVRRHPMKRKMRGGGLASTPSGMSNTIGMPSKANVPHQHKGTTTTENSIGMSAIGLNRLTDCNATSTFFTFRNRSLLQKRLSLMTYVVQPRPPFSAENYAGNRTEWKNASLFEKDARADINNFRFLEQVFWPDASRLVTPPRNETKGWINGSAMMTTATATTTTAAASMATGAEVSDAALLSALVGQWMRAGCDVGHAFVEIVRSGHRKLVELCLTWGFDPNKVAVIPNSSYVGARRPRNTMKKTKTKAKGETTREDRVVVTPLVVACASGHVEICKLLVKGGADVDGAGAALVTPLMAAVQHQRRSVVAFLLDRCAPNVNALQPNGTASALYYGAVNGDLETVRSLLSPKHRAVCGLEGLEAALRNMEGRSGPNPNPNP
jgi:hypothetical protein